jgi:diguanylate cyclase (GGDEF)-like protein
VGRLRHTHPVLLAVVVTTVAAAAGGGVWLLAGPGAAAALMFVLFAGRQALVAREGANLRTRVERATIALAREARLDSLTGLHRRQPLLELAGAALDDRRANGGRLALLFVDIDGFRAINDRLGTHVGDEVLRQVADRVASCCGPGDVPARMGADEFVVLRPRADGDTAGWARQVRNALSSPIGIASVRMQLRVNAAIGVVHADASFEDVGALMAEADAAMHRAKGASRTNVQMFSISQRRGGEVTTVAALREGLRNGAIRLDYQPIVALRTGAIVGAEALVRWEHPQLGTLHPAEFLSLAEAAGLMGDLGEVVLRTAVRDFATGALGDASWWVSVNLSPGELSDPRIVDRVAAAMGDFDPARLVIEIQERTMPGPFVASRLEQLAALGIRLAIDDFGAGPSTFAQLAELPLHIVKLDRSMVPVAPPARSPLERVALAHALVALAHSSGLQVVAEGIEHASEAATMREFDCEMGQGYLWHRPAPIEALQRQAADASPPASLAT